MNRARCVDESFEDYRKDQDKTEKQMRKYLKGRFVHVSQDYYANPDYGNMETEMGHIPFFPLYSHGVTFKHEKVNSSEE